MELQRPGKLRWAYSKPFEQLIVGDGSTLWIYDKELAQITKRGGGSWLVVEHGDPGMVGGADPVRGLGGAS